MKFYITKANQGQPITSATRQVRQQWFSVGIFPPELLFGLTGNRPQSAPACSFLRYYNFDNITPSTPSP
jgi:hypothetical protein